MKKPSGNSSRTVIFQGTNGAIELRGDSVQETIWGSLSEISQLFGRDKSVISRHIRNIYDSGELEQHSTVAKIATVQKEGGREIKREIDYYNLDLILSVGYRVDSKQATQFRIWATKTLKQHILNGYTINKKRIGENYDKFIQGLEDVKALLPASNQVQAGDVLALVRTFAETWVSLDAYDSGTFPTKGVTEKQVVFTADELVGALGELKNELIKKEQASDLFGQERSTNAVHGIIGNVFQSFAGQDVYPSVEEKAAHLLYFMVKNHPFSDGNKRSGAFAFVWFLRKAGLLRASFTPQALTALTLLVAESDARKKEKIVGLVLLLLEKK